MSIWSIFGSWRRQEDLRPWLPGETVTIISCDRRSGQLTEGPLFRAKVVESDGDTVTVVTGAGRKTTYEVFRAQTGWDSHPNPASPWRLAHGDVRRSRR